MLYKLTQSHVCRTYVKCLKYSFNIIYVTWGNSTAVEWGARVLYYNIFFKKSNFYIHIPRKYSFKFYIITTLRF